MKLYYVKVLTVGAMETLKEYAEEQATRLESYAQFIRRTHEQLVDKVINEVKKEWLFPGQNDMFVQEILDPLPMYVLPVTTTIEFEVYAEVNGEPMLEWQKGIAAASLIHEVLSYSTAPPVEAEELIELESVEE